MKNKILLVGPNLGLSNKSYGGGVGGYTRNMSVYLKTLSSDSFYLVPFFHTVRGHNKFLKESLIYRFLKDTLLFTAACFNEKPDFVHILGHYRRALPREFAQLIICKFLKIPFCYDLKAGAFEQEYNSGSYAYKYLIKLLIHKSDLIFIEGQKTKKFLQECFNKDPIYFPNFVPTTEIPKKLELPLSKGTIRLLYVGYCYKDKGINDLVEAAELIAKSGRKIELNIIGSEHPDFSLWVERPFHKNLLLYRHGRQNHDKVLDQLSKTDIYVYPTSHKSEGHNNSINEAMMFGRVILTSRQGFLEDVLSPNCAFFIDKININSIFIGLRDIISQSSRSQDIAKNARKKLISEYTDTKAKTIFFSNYSRLLKS